MHHFIPSKIPQNAVSVLVHGLNNDPSVLNDLTDFLTMHGSGVVVVALSGHHGDSKALRQIQKTRWLKDVSDAYQTGRTHCKSNNPFYFIGYSIGALINLNILSETLTYDKMILLAPAIAPKWTVYLAKPFYKLWGGLPIPSIVPLKYQTNWFLPVHVYKVLLELVSRLKVRGFQHSNIPTLIVMDPKDETMNFAGLKKLIAHYNLDQWKILALDSKETVRETKFHHLIINKKAMGHRNWQCFTEQVKDFFNLEG